MSRIARSMDAKTRSMPVELDVANPQGRLAAGMYPSVKWPVLSNQKRLLVLPTSVVTTSERMFVIRVKEGSAEWVDIKRGPVQGDLVEVIGPIAEGDTVLRRGTNEIRPGARLNIHVAAAKKE